jgi:hypothetical protein
MLGSRRLSPMSLAEPHYPRTDYHSCEGRQEKINKQWRLYGSCQIAVDEWIKDKAGRMAVCDRESRKATSNDEEQNCFSEPFHFKARKWNEPLLHCRCVYFAAAACLRFLGFACVTLAEEAAAAGAGSGLSRTRSSLPVLKYGTYFSSTCT